MITLRWKGRARRATPEAPPVRSWKRRLRTFWGLTHETLRQYVADNVPANAAALSYYTVFAIAPTLVIAIAIAGFLFGRDAAEGRIIGELAHLVGASTAQTIQDVVARLYLGGGGVWATVLGLIALIIGAVTVFKQLQNSLNLVWNVEPNPKRPVRYVVMDYVLSFSMVVSVGFILLVSLVVSALLTFFTDHLQHLMQGVPGWLVQAVNFFVSLGVVILLFAVIFKVLPKAVIRWADLWPGAILAGVLFTLGKHLIGLYLGRAAVANAFGVAGSVVVLLLWVYYSAQLVLIGAEFSQVLAAHRGHHIYPKADARHIRWGETGKPSSPRPPGKPHPPTGESAQEFR